MEVNYESMPKTLEECLNLMQFSKIVTLICNGKWQDNLGFCHGQQLKSKSEIIDENLSQL